MKQKKKNKFYTFLLSFVPGAAEMYMGFMKKGLSLMTLFWLTLCAQLTIGRTSFFMFAAILCWFYSFFHARNLAACEEEDFQKLQDDFIWSDIIEDKNIQISNPTLRKVGAGILIVLGSVMLWENFSEMIYRLIPDIMWDILAPIVSAVPEVVVALLIIFIGVRLIQGKKEELDGEDK